MSRAKKLARRKAWRVRSAEKTSDRFPHSRNHLSCCGVLVSRSVFFGCIDFSFMSGSWATAEGSVLREDVSTVPVERTLKSTKESLCHECAAVHTIENHEGSISVLLLHFYPGWYHFKLKGSGGYDMRKWEIPLLLPLMATIINLRKHRVVQESFFYSTCCIGSEVLVLGKHTEPK